MRARLAEIMYQRRGKNSTTVLPMLIASLALTAPRATASAAGLKLQKLCGEIECFSYTYCDPSQMLCRECEPVCNATSRTYHPATCEVYCQDFIHDNVKGYSRHVPVDFINTIYWQQNVTLVLVILLFAIVGGQALRKWYKFFITRRQRRIDKRKFKEKLASVQYSINNKNSSLNDGSIKCIAQPAPRSTLPSTLTTQTETTPCSTNSNAQSTSRTLPLSNEEPSEDATLDYAAYVNQCLTRSPSTEVDLGVNKKY